MNYWADPDEPRARERDALAYQPFVWEIVWDAIARWWRSLRSKH